MTLFLIFVLVEGSAVTRPLTSCLPAGAFAYNVLRTASTVAAVIGFVIKLTQPPIGVPVSVIKRYSYSTVTEVLFRDPLSAILTSPPKNPISIPILSQISPTGQVIAGSDQSVVILPLGTLNEGNVFAGNKAPV